MGLLERGVLSISAAVLEHCCGDVSLFNELHLHGTRYLVSEKSVTDMSARLAMATALSHETGVDISPDLLVATDRMLIQLFLLGYIVYPVELENESVSGGD